MFRTVFCIAVCLYIFNEISAKPSNILDLKDGNLVNKFAEFLREDKEISAALEKEFNSDSLNRKRRQTELDDMNNMNLDGATPIPKKDDGFFDRAAKFMMELLQRFMKWVNTD